MWDLNSNMFGYSKAFAYSSLYLYHFLCSVFFSQDEPIFIIWILIKNFYYLLVELYSREKEIISKHLLPLMMLLESSTSQENAMFQPSKMNLLSSHGSCGSRILHHPWLKHVPPPANEDSESCFTPSIVHSVMVGTGPWLHSQNQYLPKPSHSSIPYYVCFHGGCLREKETDIDCVNRAYCRVGSEVILEEVQNFSK